MLIGTYCRKRRVGTLKFGTLKSKFLVLNIARVNENSIAFLLCFSLCFVAVL